MEVFTLFLNKTSAIATILGQIFLFVFLLIYLAITRGKSVNKKLLTISDYLVEKHQILAFVVVVMATFVSVIYSDIIGYEPCKLCWVQRIFLYPQVVILGIAIWKKTKDSEVYCLFLSVIGGLIALYHFYGQSFNPDALSVCGVTSGASCAINFFTEFGYITIPMMSLTSFAILSVLFLVGKKHATVV